MLPLDSALEHRSEFDRRWFLAPLAVVLVTLFAFGIVVMLPRPAPDAEQALAVPLVPESAPAMPTAAAGAGNGAALVSTGPVFAASPIPVAQQLVGH